MRILRTIAVVTMVGGLAGAAQAAPQLDAKGKCRDGGKFVAAAQCKTAVAAKPAAKCRDTKGHFVKCGAPGAKPA